MNFEIQYSLNVLFCFILFFPFSLLLSLITSKGFFASFLSKKKFEFFPHHQGRLLPPIDRRHDR